MVECSQEVQNPVTSPAPSTTTMQAAGKIITKYGTTERLTSPATNTESDYPNYPDYGTLEPVLRGESSTAAPAGIHAVATGSKGIISIAQLLEERPTKITDLKIRKENIGTIPESFFGRIPNDLTDDEDEGGRDQASGESIKGSCTYNAMVSCISSKTLVIMACLLSP